MGGGVLFAQPREKLLFAFTLLAGFFFRDRPFELSAASLGFLFGPVDSAVRHQEEVALIE